MACYGVKSLNGLKEELFRLVVLSNDFTNRLGGVSQLNESADFLFSIFFEESLVRFGEMIWEGSMLLMDGGSPSV